MAKEEKWYSDDNSWLEATGEHRAKEGETIEGEQSSEQLVTSL